MVHEAIPAPATNLPTIRRIGPADLLDALTKGWDDFLAMPTHAIFLCFLYPVVGLILARAAFGYELIPLLFPLAAGFALLGPFAAIGLYELSRRRELGQDTPWQRAFDVLYSPSLRGIIALGVILSVIFLVWIGVAQSIYVANFGYREPDSLTGFLYQVLTTVPGRNLILLGNGIGFLFAAVVLTISVVSFPMLLDRDVSVTVAVATSISAVFKNPTTMALWGLIVAVALFLGSLPLFFGLAVVMPVLGHATWHLYRKVVEPDPDARHERRPTPPGHRYAADFPAVLFPWTREH